MHSPLFEINKLLPIERKAPAYMNTASLPHEYLHFIMPHAGIYFKDDDECKILSQHIQLEDFSVWVHDVFAMEDIVLCPFTPFHIWTLHFMHKNSFQTFLSNTKEFLLEENECNLFNLHTDIQRIPMKAGQKMFSFHINLQPDALPALAEKYPGLEYLAAQQTAGYNSVINKRPWHISPVAELLIDHIVHCRYIGSQAHYYIRRCCIDIFSNFLEQEQAADTPMLVTNVLEEDLFRNIFTYIADHPHIIHTIEQLSLLFGLSQEQLVQGFNRYLFISIASFLHMTRMMMLYDILHNNTVPLSSIASMAGYATESEMLEQLDAYYGCNAMSVRN